MQNDLQNMWAQQMREAELEFYRQYAPRLIAEPPVSTVIEPYALARPDYLIEMDALSVITKGSVNYFV